MSSGSNTKLKYAQVQNLDCGKCKTSRKCEVQERRWQITMEGGG